MTKHSFTYLALGDSYTIGESVPLHESFPYIVAQILREQNIHIHAPEIVAKTGWTTFELAEHILHHKLQEKYDFVTLLIGVNNQYRGLKAEDYKEEFEFLLKKAIQFADNKSAHVIILSIPDWGITKYAAGHDSKQIESDIDEFNAINKDISSAHDVQYINITEETRKVKTDDSLLAKDGLHYSEKAHRIWAEKVAQKMIDIIGK